eukprot:1315332-Prymnesium_polylepis.1
MQPTPHPRCPARSQCAASQRAMARRAVSSVLALAAAALAFTLTSTPHSHCLHHPTPSERRNKRCRFAA